MAANRSKAWTIVAASIALALLAVLTVWLNAEDIEADIAARANAALAAGGFTTLGATADGRIVTVAGTPPSEDRRRAALASVDAVWGVASVIDGMPRAEGPNAEAPAQYRFGATWDGRTLALTGYMPTRDAREDIVTHARDTLKGAEVLDGVQVAPGAPDPNWPAIVAAGIAAMKSLANGTLTVTGTEVSLSGVTPRAAGRAEAVRILEALPAPYTSKIDVVIREPDANAVAGPAPYRFGAAYDGVSLALTGAVPSNGAKAELVAAARAALPGKSVDDRLKVDPAAPDGAWTDAALVALGALKHLTAASLEGEGRRFALSGIAASATAREDLLKTLRDLPAAYEIAASIGLAGEASPTEQTIAAAGSPAAACQQAFDTAFAEGGIVFASGKAALPDGADAFIARLAEIAATCPEARLAVGGHTDASGREPANQTLSEDRAAAVEAALIVKGVAADRISAKGYGSSRPVAPNDTDEGKARNRRIEVIVRP